MPKQTNNPPHAPLSACSVMSRAVLCRLVRPEVAACSWLGWLSSPAPPSPGEERGGVHLRTAPHRTTPTTQRLSARQWQRNRQSRQLSEWQGAESEQVEQCDTSEWQEPADYLGWLVAQRLGPPTVMPCVWLRIGLAGWLAGSRAGSEGFGWLGLNWLGWLREDGCWALKAASAPHPPPQTHIHTTLAAQGHSKAALGSSTCNTANNKSE